jgi:ATP-dependent DNA ligase
MLELNGRDFRREPWTARREALADLLRGAGPGLPVRPLSQNG